MYFYLLLIVAVSLLQTGCSNFTSKNVNTIDIARNERITLQIDNALPVNTTVTQSVTATHNGKEYEMLAIVEMKENALTMVGMSAFGAQLFSVVYADGVVAYNTSPLVLEDIEPDYMLADFLLCYWPIDILKNRLDDTSLQVQESWSDVNKRVLYRDSLPIIEISYEHKNPWQGRVIYHHIERDYKITIDSLKYEVL